jgi:hypothetical protein
MSVLPDEGRDRIAISSPAGHGVIVVFKSFDQGE